MAATFGYREIFLFMIMPIVITLSVISRLNDKCRRRQKTSLPTNWPLVGMLPSVLQNSHRFQDYFTEILSESGGTFQLRFPRVFNMDMLITSDPANINHIFSKNFANYPKGPEFRKIFEILGDSIFNVDNELWEFQRRTTHSFMTHPEFNSLLESVVWEKVENGLLPVLDDFHHRNIEFDLQDVFQRFTYDSICKMALDVDPMSLSVDLPFVPSMHAFGDSIGVVFYRHILPEFVWKLQRRLRIGRERKLLEAWKVFDEFIYPLVSSNIMADDGHHHHLNLLTTFRKAYEEKHVSSLIGGGGGGGDSSSRSRDEKFLRDTVLGLMVAGRDTSASGLTWFFWLIATNPTAKTKILEEIETVLSHLKDDGNGAIKWGLFDVQESRKLIYLHAALCESLRLFPPGPVEHKSPVKPDNLPSGDYIEENAKVLISFYSVGRTESIWGEDCLEFKPERWIISTSGGGEGIIKHVPSYKFPAFNVGPRTCVGKEMAFFEMKMVAATIMYYYDVHLVENHPVSPRHDSVLLEMKHGLKVTLSKRDF